MKLLVRGLIIVAILLVVLILAVVLRNKFNPEIPVKKYPSSSFAPNPGSCLVLDEANCRKVSVEKWQYQNETYLIAGFHLNEGTHIFSPIDGQTSANKAGSPFNGSIIVVKPDNPADSTIYTFVGQFGVDKPYAKSIKKGGQIGIIQKEKVENINGYNFVILITKNKTSGNGFEPDDLSVTKLFSEIKR